MAAILRTSRLNRTRRECPTSSERQAMRLISDQHPVVGGVIGYGIRQCALWTVDRFRVATIPPIDLEYDAIPVHSACNSFPCQRAWQRRGKRLDGVQVMLR